MLAFVLRLVFLPLFLLGGNGLAIYLVAHGYGHGWLLLLLLSFIAMAFIAERLAPYDRGFNASLGDRRRDFSHALVNESLSVLGVMMVPLFAVLVPWPSIWPVAWPLWQQLLMAVLIADVGITLVHYASHRVAALWHLHAVHHSVKRMYGFNGLMKHPLHQMLETLGGTAPLLMLGIPQDVLMLLVVAVVLQLLVQHSNVAYFTGPLKRILAVNAVHRFHHLNSAKEGDVNFGFFTTLTDYCLGTAYYDQDRVIGSEHLGIGDQPDYPVTYAEQMLEPFKRGASK